MNGSALRTIVITCEFIVVSMHNLHSANTYCSSQIPYDLTHTVGSMGQLTQVIYIAICIDFTVVPVSQVLCMRQK